MKYKLQASQLRHEILSTTKISRSGGGGVRSRGDAGAEGLREGGKEVMIKGGRKGWGMRKRRSLMGVWRKESKGKNGEAGGKITEK